MESAGKRKGKRVPAQEATAAPKRSKRSLPTPEDREKLMLCVVEKAKMPASEADNLDYKAYNKSKLVMANKMTLRGVEARCETHRGFCDQGSNKYDGLVLLLEDGVCYAVDVITPVHAWACHRLCAALNNKHFMASAAGCTKMDVAGSRAMQISGRLNQLRSDPMQPPPIPRGTGCDSSNHRWPVGIMNFGSAQTLPELLDNGESLLAVNQRVRIFIGFKQYELKTEQLVAVVLYKKEGDDTIIGEAVSFGTRALDDATLQVLQNRKIEVRGIGCGDEPCDKPGIQAYQLKLPGEATSHGSGHPRMDRFTDLFAVQAWLSNNRDIQPKLQDDCLYPHPPRFTPEELKAYQEFTAKPENKSVTPLRKFFMGLAPICPPVVLPPPGEKYKCTSKKSWLLRAEQPQS